MLCTLFNGVSYEHKKVINVIVKNHSNTNRHKREHFKTSDTCRWLPKLACISNFIQIRMYIDALKMLTHSHAMLSQLSRTYTVYNYVEKKRKRNVRIFIKTKTTQQEYHFEVNLYTSDSMSYLNFVFRIYRWITKHGKTFVTEVSRCCNSRLTATRGRGSRMWFFSHIDVSFFSLFV